MDRAIFRALRVSGPRILLANPNISDLVTEILTRESKMIAGARAEIRAVSPSFGSASLECRAEAVIAAHGMLETIAANLDCDAAIIAAFGDPGLEAAREISPMPVFGLGQSGLRAVAGKGRRYAIVTVGPRLRRDIERAAATHAPKGSLVALRFLDISVLDAARDRVAVQAAALAAANDCVKREGAEAVLFGGAPFAGIGRTLSPHVAAPLYDGLETAIEEAIAAPRPNIAEAPPPSSPAKARRRVSSALAREIDGFLAASAPNG
jgi:Asp/Glu/hydantoin racemase